MAEQAQRRSTLYQLLLVGLLSLNFGIVFFDRNALNFLMPFVQPDLGLSNTQVGMLASSLSLSWALSALGIGWLTDRVGRRKMLLVGATLAFSLCSVLSGLASSFALLLGARLLMGAAEGGIMPISHTIIARDVAPRWRGVAQGVGQNLGSSLIGAFIAPLLLVWIARTYGWNDAFYLAGLPGLATALLIWRFIDEPAPATVPAAATAAHERKPGFLAALAQRNVLICVFMGVMLVAYIVICWAFLPLYLTQVRGYAPEKMSWFLGTLGISAFFSSFSVPAVSDRIGRRPVVVVMSLGSAILPLAALYFTGPDIVLAGLFFISWMKNGILPLLMATIPSESVDPRLAATALGIGMGASELLGGVFSPSLAGMVADATDLSAPLWIMVALSIAAALAGLFLRETAPRLIANADRRPKVSPAPAARPSPPPHQ